MMLPIPQDDLEMPSTRPSFPKIYVVSLPRSPKRPEVTQRLSDIGLDFEWIDGVVIDRMEDIPFLERHNLEAYGIPRLLTDPVYVCRSIGCKRAMMNAIRAAAESLDEWVIILQDDAYFVEGFAQRCRDVFRKIPRECGVVMLHYVGGGVQLNERFNEAVGLCQIVGNVRRMTAFAVRPSFSLALYKEIERFGGEEDRIWAVMARKGYLVLATYPQLVYCTQRGSDIVGGIPELAWVWS